MKNIFILFIFFSCASYDQFKEVTNDLSIPTETYSVDYNRTWKAVIELVTQSNFPILEQNQEAGVIKTRWSDNTTEVNFADSFGSTDRIKAAQFKLTINVAKGFRLNQEVTQVSIIKRQLIENDFLQGFKEITSDQIQEKTLLYRLSRIISIDKQLEKIDEAKQQEQLNNF